MATLSYSMETDISSLEAPTFTTIDRGQPQAMLALDWDHPVNLVGKKVLNPMIHCCDQCLKPILIYGRMIPCKHVFCLACAKQEDRKCGRCGDKVSRVEQAGLGNIFLCTQGGSRYGNTGCRRTYLSSRDLQAHIQHRHNKNNKEDEKVAEKKEVSNNEAIRNAVNSLSKASLAAAVAAASSAAAYSSSAAAVAGGAYSSGGTTYSTPANGPPHHGSHISVINTTRQSNLITVPLQSEAAGLAGAEAAAPGGQPVYVPPSVAGSGGAAYSAYSAYTSGSTSAPVQPPAAVGYPPASAHFSQPPPSYPYGSTYASSAGAAQYQSPAGQYQQAPPPAPAAAAYASAPPGGYPGAPAPPGQYQGQWSRPPPAGPHQTYYRR